ncbi:MAG: DUF4912 domain-containing protein, partial [Verrucomicrobia bacterium]|nr:DUF4912 domain-containing protein [Verrucomicrobiota bacterium]
MSQEPNKPNPTFQNASVEGAARSNQRQADFKPEPEQLGELPSGYGDMFVVARDPHWLFTYWDFDYSKLPDQRQLGLHVFRDGALETTIDINEIARNWYIPVQAANASYRVVFGYKDSQGTWHYVGEAGPTHTPPEAVSTEWDTLFATVPIHLTFNLLVDVVDAAKSRGEPLAEALARLQQAALNGGSRSPNWGLAQLQMLETLFGKGLLARLSSMDSSELSTFLRADLSSPTSSESASELVAKSRLAQLLAPAESSLFSGGILGAALSSELFQSGGALSSAALSSFGLSSGELVTRLSSMGLSSAEITTLLSSELLSSETLSSAGLSSAELSSGLLSKLQINLAELSSLGLSSLGLSSLGLSSFAQLKINLAELSSLNLSSFELSSAALSSERFSALQLAAVEMGALSSEQLSSAWSSSWSGLEFGLSSWGELISESSLFSAVGASWGGESFGLTQREFFMHVNAEVIFYGGTHPDAKVTVAGQPIQLQPDGTFRYHFIFPDRDFEIPIVAVSPDGKETRSAVLFFRRETTRQGDVGHTA